MKRYATEKLIEWKNTRKRKPLIIRGASLAASLLMKNGYSELKILSGGMDAWIKGDKL